jgi:hypothetical protein
VLGNISPEIALTPCFGDGAFLALICIIDSLHSLQGEPSIDDEPMVQLHGIIGVDLSPK